MRNKVTDIITVLFLIAGIALLSLNVAGLFLSLRNPEILDEKNVFFKNDISLGLEDVEREIVRRPGEGDEHYALRMNRVVNQGLARYWSEEGIDKYHLRVPLWENYILYFKSLTDPERFLKYEFIDPGKALERGVGLCSQHAMILKGLLDQNGIETSIVPLDGHVVTRVKTAENRWIVADPDHGVIIPHDIYEIMDNPSLVRPFYEDVRDNYSNPDRPDLASIGERMAAIYGPVGNYVLPDLRLYKGYYLYALEYYSYIAKWLLPLLLIFPFMARTLKKPSREARTLEDFETTRQLRSSSQD